MTDTPRTYPAAPDYPDIEQDLYRLLRLGGFNPYYQSTHPNPQTPTEDYEVVRDLLLVPDGKAGGTQTSEVIVRTLFSPEKRNHTAHKRHVWNVVLALRPVHDDTLSDTVLGGKHLELHFLGARDEGVQDGCWQTSVTYSNREGRAFGQ